MLSVESLSPLTLRINYTQVDVANAIPGTIMEVNDPPETLYVSKQTKIFVGVIIGICSLISLVMFIFIVVHRKHRVMTLAQGGLLAWLTASSFCTIVFSFLLSLPSAGDVRATCTLPTLFMFFAMEYTFQ